MSESAMAAGGDVTDGGFEAWCRCVRRLLGWDEGAMEIWRQLYATGHTPRDAARVSIYGDSQGD